MAIKKKKSISFLEELRSSETADLDEKLLSLKKELFFLREEKAMNKQVKIHRFGKIRKDIARILTVKTEKIRN